ncbi:MAG: hypothetical protein ACPGO5_04175 [Patescibacteria group bacterium]
MLKRKLEKYKPHDETPATVSGEGKIDLKRVQEGEARSFTDQESIDPAFADNIGADVFDSEKGLYFYEVDEGTLQKLPEDWAYIGGVSRSLLIKHIHGDGYPSPIDVDLRYFGDKDYAQAVEDLPEIPYLDEAGLVGAAKDVYELEDHFELADFTINQSVIFDNKLIFTKQAYEDVQNRVIRPTESTLKDDRDRNIQNDQGDSPLRSRILTRAIKFYTEFSKEFGDAKYEDIEEWQWELGKIYSFDLAKYLDTAFEKGDEYGMRFFTEVMKSMLFEKKIEYVEDLTVQLRWNLRKENRRRGIDKPVKEFKSAPTERMKKLARMYEGGGLRFYKTQVGKETELVFEKVGPGIEDTFAQDLKYENITPAEAATILEEDESGVEVGPVTRRLVQYITKHDEESI